MTNKEYLYLKSAISQRYDKNLSDSLNVIIFSICFITIFIILLVCTIILKTIMPDYVGQFCLSVAFATILTTFGTTIMIFLIIIMIFGQINSNLQVDKNKDIKKLDECRNNTFDDACEKLKLLPKKTTEIEEE